jgi:hypothetical protein
VTESPQPDRDMPFINARPRHVADVQDASDPRRHSDDTPAAIPDRSVAFHSFIHSTEEDSIMKTRYKLAISFGLTAIGLLGLQGTAMALTTQGALVCKGNGAVAAGLYFDRHGVWNGGDAQGVYCPVPRLAAAPASGFSVLVDGFAPPGTTVYCSMYSDDWNDAFVGYVAAPALTGKFSFYLTLPQSQVPTFSTQTVYCHLPHYGELFNVDPS